MTNILVEGGAEVHGSFRDAEEIDEAHVFIAPMLVGGAAAKSAVGGRGVDRLASALRMAEWEMDRVGADLYFHGRRSSGLEQ